MPNKLIQRLEHGARLSDEDRRLLLDAITVTVDFPAHNDIVQEGDRPEFLYAMLDGIACRHKVLSSGERQILGFLVPGDLGGSQGAILSELDHGIATISACTLACIPHTRVQELTASHPTIAKAIWWSSLTDESIQRDWLANIGQRPADKRMAHLFCELHARMDAVGLVANGGFNLPITQEEIGDTLGISTVHTNRVLQQMRSDGRITFGSGRLVIHDIEEFSEFGDFTPNYLYLEEHAKQPRHSATVLTMPPPQDKIAG